MVYFDGKNEAKVLDAKIASFTNANKLDKKLLIIQIGHNESSEKYIKLKMKLCNKFGIPYQYEIILDSLSDKEIFTRVESLFAQPDIGGGIIQLPFPRYSLKNVVDLIPCNQDLDLLSNTNIAQYYAGKSIFIPPVVRAVKHFLLVTETKIKDMHIYLLGGSTLVGVPVCSFLLKEGAKVTILDKPEIFQQRFLHFKGIEYLPSYKQGVKLNCDLLITSTGIPNLVRGEDIKEGSNVIDFGSTVVDGKTIGDLDYASELGHLGMISPSPGGMGPLVVRYLIMNFLHL